MDMPPVSTGPSPFDRSVILMHPARFEAEAPAPHGPASDRACDAGDPCRDPGGDRERLHAAAYPDEPFSSSFLVVAACSVSKRRPRDKPWVPVSEDAAAAGTAQTVTLTQRAQ